MAIKKASKKIEGMMKVMGMNRGGSKMAGTGDSFKKLKTKSKAKHKKK